MGNKNRRFTYQPPSQLKEDKILVCTEKVRALLVCLVAGFVFVLF